MIVQGSAFLADRVYEVDRPVIGLLSHKVCPNTPKDSSSTGKKTILREQIE